ncbi:Methyltransferase small [Macrophomina phaseolina MS6]|uniref:Methyltransferase small n=1 Tax=Macrophomina phaseolina (strain MS6) TaxID=1126212 RepID=K2S032_MACPH|nr:Methyltransferase small [Macrophomina phaseolina MS6]
MATDTSIPADDSAAWQAEPTYTTACELAYKALLEHVPNFQHGAKKPDVLEVGCGSGVLASMLAPHTHTLVGLDTSASAVAAFNAKVQQQGAQHMEAVAFDWENPNFEAAPQTQVKLMERVDGTVREGPVRSDVILRNPLTSRWPNLLEWFQISYFGLNPGGRVAAVCLEHQGPETALFYPPSQRKGNLMCGYKADEVSTTLRDAGFADVSVRRAFSVTKTVDAAEAGGRTSLEFSFALVQGSKPPR